MTEDTHASTLLDWPPVISCMVETDEGLADEFLLSTVRIRLIYLDRPSDFSSGWL